MKSRPIAETIEHIERIRGQLESADAALEMAKASVRNLSSKVIEPLDRDDFESDRDFRRAAQDQSLKIMTSTMSQEALDLINSDEILIRFRDLDDETRDRIDELSRQHSEQLRELLGPDFADLFPPA